RSVHSAAPTHKCSTRATFLPQACYAYMYMRHDRQVHGAYVKDEAAHLCCAVTTDQARHGQQAPRVTHTANPRAASGRDVSIGVGKGFSGHLGAGTAQPYRGSTLDVLCTLS